MIGSFHEWVSKYGRDWEKLTSRAFVDDAAHEELYAIFTHLLDMSDKPNKIIVALACNMLGKIITRLVSSSLERLYFYPQ